MGQWIAFTLMFPVVLGVTTKSASPLGLPVSSFSIESEFDLSRQVFNLVRNEANQFMTFENGLPRRWTPKDFGLASERIQRQLADRGVRGVAVRITRQRETRSYSLTITLAKPNPGDA